MQIDRLQKKCLQIDPSIRVSVKRDCIVLEGEVDQWDKAVKAGHLASKEKSLGVINDIRMKGFVEKPNLPSIKDKSLQGKEVDVLVIGAGIVGCSVARELARTKLKTLVVEKAADIAMGQSGRNGGVVHVGINFGKHSLKHKYNAWGNAYYDQLSKEMDVPFEREGQVMFIRHGYEKLLTAFVRLYGRSIGVSDVRYLKRDELKKIEPSVPDWAIGGIHMAIGGMTCPYKMSIALAENAADNGVEFAFETAVLDMKVIDGKITEVITNRGTIYPKTVINAAGVYSDRIAEMADDRTFTIHPRKGTYLIVDKKKGDLCRTSAGKAPYTISPYQDETIHGSPIKFIKTILTNLHSHSKGIGIIHTVDNNILLGPDATETPDREDLTTTKETTDFLYKVQHEVQPAISKADIITYFTGIRACNYEEEFVVRQGLWTKNIFEMAAIQSPGITAAPAIGIDVAKWVGDYLKEQGVSVEPNASFNPIHHFPPKMHELNDQQRDELIKKNPAYGEIICRCEEISRGEIEDCLKSPIPIYTLDGIKRRVRPGMGRCQGGFCSPQVLKIISEISGKRMSEIAKAVRESAIVFDNTK